MESIGFVSGAGITPEIILFCFAGSVLGLFVGAIPGLSVTMATALLVSLTYTWETDNALAMIMGIYVTGVFSGAISAILFNIPGAPSSVATALDGYPLAKRGHAKQALQYAAVYSFTGCIFGLMALRFLAGPVSRIALSFWPMDYFLLALFGLLTIGALSGNSLLKGLVMAGLGFFCSMIGMDSVFGTPRFTFGVEALNAGIPVLPALIGLFGLAEVLTVWSEKLSGHMKQMPDAGTGKDTLDGIILHVPHSLLYSLTGTLIGALPGAGSPVASLVAYAQAKRLVKNPTRPFGEGAIEGIVASESANNACIGGALIPMLALGIPGDAVTAVMLSVFQIHGLQPGPMFLTNGQSHFQTIVCAGLICSVFLLLLGLFAAPHMSIVFRIPEKWLMPFIALTCVFGAYIGSRRLFDVGIMLCFGIFGFLVKKKGFPVAPMTLALVLGRMMESNFRRALSLASSEEHLFLALFGRPVTMLLTGALIVSVLLHVIRIIRYHKK